MWAAFNPSARKGWAALLFVVVELSTHCPPTVNQILDTCRMLVYLACAVMKHPPRPSKKLLDFIDAYGGVNAAATAWDIPYNTLNRFIEGTNGMSLAMAMQISQRLGVPMHKLFEQSQPQEAPRSRRD